MMSCASAAKLAQTQTQSCPIFTQGGSDILRSDPIHVGGVGRGFQGFIQVSAGGHYKFLKLLEYPTSEASP